MAKNQLVSLFFHIYLLEIAYNYQHDDSLMYYSNLDEQHEKSSTPKPLSFIAQDIDSQMDESSVLNVGRINDYALNIVDSYEESIVSGRPQTRPYYPVSTDDESIRGPNSAPTQSIAQSTSPIKGLSNPAHSMTMEAIIIEHHQSPPRQKVSAEKETQQESIALDVSVERL